MGCLLGGCLPRGGAGVHHHPTCGQTDACENVTFPQLLLRTVMKNIDVVRCSLDVFSKNLEVFQSTQGCIYTSALYIIVQKRKSDT